MRSFLFKKNFALICHLQRWKVLLADLITDKAVLNIDVLGSGVGNWLLGQENGALVISSRKDGMIAFEMLSLPLKRYLGNAFFLIGNRKTG